MSNAVAKEIERPQPGAYPLCRERCRRYLENTPSPEDFHCKAAWPLTVWADQPEMEVEGDFVISCRAYKPNLETIIKELPETVPVLLRAVELSLRP